MREEGSKWLPPDSAAGAPPGVNAGTPAGAADTAEKFDMFTSGSGSAAHGVGIWTPLSLANERRGQARATAARACPDRPNLSLIHI
eukprot:7841149-Pyramimonas_sp.AAC.1